MRLHREGTPTLLLVTAVVCFGLFALVKWPVLPIVVSALIGFALVAVLGIVLWFFRVPKRPLPKDDAAIFSPCDGKVVVIEDVYEPEYFKDKRRQVSIFMSPLNVHINYHPIGGTTTYYKYHPGKYLVAWHPKSSTENERSTVVNKHPEHGEVLFRQSRVGRDGRLFTCFKFRSMVDGADAERERLRPHSDVDGPIFKMREDPRITRVGRVIRRYSIDELPQLFNVLRGDMSLVGPRPPMPTEVNAYAEWHRRRLDIAPGLTGLWQVSGRSDLTFDEMVMLDLFYAENWSLFLDLKILLRTVPTVLRGTGAY